MNSPALTSSSYQQRLKQLLGQLEHPGNPAQILTPNFPLAQQLRRLRLNQLSVRAAKASEINVLIKGIVESIESARLERSRKSNTELWPIATEAQLAYLWEKVINSQEDGTQLNPGDIAGSALSAWRNLKRQRVDLDELKQMELGQLVKFSQWCDEFETILKQNKLTTLEQEIEFFLSLPQIANKKQGTLYLYAFIDKPSKLWMEWFEHRFIRVEQIDYLPYGGAEFPETEDTNYLHASESLEDELEAALDWAKIIGRNNPQARIAIIDTHLKDNLKKTKRLFSSDNDGIETAQFAQAESLTETGVFQTALALLQQNQKELPLAVARQIIHSPCWGNYITEYDFRLLWDKSLCDKKVSVISSIDFRAILQELTNLETGQETNSIESKLNTAFAKEGRVSNSKLMPLEWADLFQKQLDVLELGIHVKIQDSERWQGWIDALGEFTSLGTVTGKIHIEEALKLLGASCRRNSAQLGAPRAGIAVLDTIEAAADYTHIWLMGVDNINWPAAPSPNPLLPVPLQIKYDMPRASVEVEAHIAKRLLERLKSAAKETVFSYCRFDTDGETELRPSPMLGLLQKRPVTQSTQGKQKKTFADHRFEWVDCSRAPEVPPENRAVSGGASLIKTMIASPLDAFSYWRLGAYELGKPQVGLSAADRGNLVHNVLEQVWDEIVDSATLAQLSENTVLEKCTLAASKQLRRYQYHRAWLDQAYIELESKRIGLLVANWLEFERNRPAFKKVQSEEKLRADIAGLTFDMRLDRLDQLENGELLLVDYKTGAGLSRKNLLPTLSAPPYSSLSIEKSNDSTINDSAIEPPVEPQLPLYAINLETPPDAICFAQVRTEKQQFIGIGKDSYLQGIEAQENWKALFQLWHQSLENSAKAYIEGDCRAFETKTLFGQTDPLAPLHRFAEYEQLEIAKTSWETLEKAETPAQQGDDKTNNTQLGLF